MPTAVELPAGVQKWFNEQGWTLGDVHPISGGYAAKLYRILATDATGMSVRLIYKQFAVDRTHERYLYRDVFAGLPDLVPRVLGFVQETDEEGILMVDCGVTLKKSLLGLEFAEQTKLLERAVCQLADMHIEYESQLGGLIERGLEATYPIQSAVTWTKFSLDMLGQLAASHFHAILTWEEVERLTEMTAWFYPRYKIWLDGRVTLTHGDPHLENILVVNGRFSLIDWEASCVTVPQRDLAIFLQDILDDEQNQTVSRMYFRHLQDGGWEVDREDFYTAFQAVYFDNTIMMLGWEIYKYQQGYLTAAELAVILTTKLQWLHKSFAYLYDN